MIQLDLPLAPPAAPARARRRPSQRRPGALARLARYLAAWLGTRRKTRTLEVFFNSRLRTAVGRADFAACAIELNGRLLDRHPEELVPTLVHELCHLVAGARAAHGARWREAVAALTVRRRAWTWSCVGCGETYRRSHRRASEW